jgi:hypothetical protein
MWSQKRDFPQNIDLCNSWRWSASTEHLLPDVCCSPTSPAVHAAVGIILVWNPTKTRASSKSYTLSVCTVYEARCTPLNDAWLLRAWTQDSADSARLENAQLHQCMTGMRPRHVHAGFVRYSSDAFTSCGLPVLLVSYSSDARMEPRLAIIQDTKLVRELQLLANTTQSHCMAFWLGRGPSIQP